MKVSKLFVIFASSILAVSAFGNTSIATAMKEMSTALKTITAQASIATDNASSAALCDQITAGIEAAKSQTPDSVASLPDPTRAQQEQAYVALLNQLEAQVATLKADFVAGNNAQAVTDIAAIGSTKKTGHTQFNKN